MKIPLLATLPLICVKTFSGDFTNLTFDEPDLTGSLRPADLGNPRTPFYGLTSQILRGWTLLGNGQPLTEITYQPGVGDTFGPATLIRRQTSSGENFYMRLNSQPPNIVDLTLRQTGTVPVVANSLTFLANSPMQLIVNGDVLYTVDTAVTTLPTVDLSRYAGQNVTLDFHVLQHPNIGATFSFDVLGFTQIPEPSTWALFGVGALALSLAVKRIRTPVHMVPTYLKI
jgi:hypothetical protein